MKKMLGFTKKQWGFLLGHLAGGLVVGEIAGFLFVIWFHLGVAWVALCVSGYKEGGELIGRLKERGEFINNVSANIKVFFKEIWDTKWKRAQILIPAGLAAVASWVGEIALKAIGVL